MPFALLCHRLHELNRKKAEAYNLKLAEAEWAYSSVLSL